MVNKNNRIFVAGHKGMVGSSICRKLKQFGYKNIIVADKRELDLLNQNKVYKYLRKNKPNLLSKSKKSNFLRFKLYLSAKFQTTDERKIYHVR